MTNNRECFIRLDPFHPGQCHAKHLRRRGRLLTRSEIFGEFRYKVELNSDIPRQDRWSNLARCWRTTRMKPTSSTSLTRKDLALLQKFAWQASKSVTHA
jgi:hypothetical protein